VITDPRPVRVESQKSNLTSSSRMWRRPRAPRPTGRFACAESLRARLEQPDMLSRLLRPCNGEIPVLGETLEADFAFQNGRLNLFRRRSSCSTVRRCFARRIQIGRRRSPTFKQAPVSSENDGSSLWFVPISPATQPSNKIVFARWLLEHDVKSIPAIRSTSWLN